MSAVLKPSPNEEAQLMREESQRRRKLRILQVREQEKMVAIRIRRAMQEKHEKEISNLANALEKKWKKDHEVELKASEEKFAACLKDVGVAHEDAKENEPNQALMDAIYDENRKIAKERGKTALVQDRISKRMAEQESIEKRRMRHVALIKEKLRAKHIASLPAPIPNPADTYLASTVSTNPSQAQSSGSIPHHPGRYATVKISDHESTLSTTVALGLPSNAVVERATAEEAATDAREEAKREGERISLLQAERDRAVQECMEKAKVRHLAALEQARLDQESRELMNDLKQLRMKDALRRQHHIEYKWDDNTNAKRACQELFGPPGAKYQESELFSRDLKDAKGDEMPSYLEESDPSFGSQNTTGWQDASPQEEDVRKPGVALNRLLKQIEAQRQQRKAGSRSESTSAESENPNNNLQVEIQVRDDSETAEEESDAEDAFRSKPKAGYSTSVIPIGGTKTIPKEVAIDPEVTKGSEVLSPPKSPKVVQENAPVLSFASTVSTQEPSTKTKSESMLEKSLESMRNDEALLKSVKEFQQRLLQQHKSCAKIQQQIQRLEQEKADVDSMVADVTKPKSF